MKKYKQFRAEQQYITEVGPFASAMMTAMAVTGLGVAGWKLFKAGKEKIKGYRETKKEKADNKEAGVFIDKKIFDPETGTTTTETIPLHKPDSSGARMSNDEVVKAQKEEQKKQDIINRKLKFKYVEAEKKNKEAIKGGKVLKYDKDSGEYSVEDPPKEPSTTPEPEEPETTEPEPEEPKTADDEKEIPKDDEGNIKNQDDAQAAFEKGDFKKAPSGWTKDPEDETGKTVIKPEDIPKKPKKKLGTGTAGARTGMAARTKPKDLDKAGVESKLLKFGEFISEGVMNDLLKAGKSKKDSEISLDDGADIPIDPLTSQILVKYIEGLSSSEKNRTIQQIQRTERAFMKVLGKAHENT